MKSDIYLQQTISVFEKNPSTEDKYLIEKLEKEGISSSISTYLILFVPIVFCRIISKTFNPKFSNEYTEHKKDGTIINHLFSENILYNSIWVASEIYINENFQKNLILEIAQRSPEFSIINEALLKNQEISKIAFSSIQIIL